MMRREKIVAGIILLAVMAGCGGGTRQTTVIRSNDGLITVDVSRSYPKKELILQDFMDVEYIPLETTDEFLTQGLVRAVGREVIVVGNLTSEGDIFMYDRNGKGVKKINRRGQSGEEYYRIIGIVLDEDNNELFVHERKMLVYDLNGTFKRSFNYHSNELIYSHFYNYNREHLIAYDSGADIEDLKKRPAYHYIISKKDGSVIREISIPFKVKKAAEVRYGSRSIGPGVVSWMIPFQGNWILTLSSADTVYMYLPDDTMLPFIARTPTIQSMDPEIYLFPQVLTEQYYFMRTVKKEWKSPNDIERFEEGFPTTNLVYDRKEQKMYECVVYNDDFSTKKTVNMSQHRRIDNEIAFYIRYEAFELVEAYKKGQLKGRLKEIAAELDKEDNPVIMLVTNKIN